ncbi:MAG TPA: hypothetical protein VF934_12235 [Burkholderiales bacterium]
MAGLRAVLLFATLLVWIVRVLGAVAPSSATATAPTFLARAFRGPITRLALFHCGQRRILTRWPLLLLRLLATVLLRLALCLFLVAIASLIATAVVRILAWTAAWFVAFVAIAAAVRATVPVIAA